MEIMTEPLGSVQRSRNSNCMAKSTETHRQCKLASMAAPTLSMKDGTLALENETECQAQLDIPTHSRRFGILTVRLNNEKKEKGQGLTSSLPFLLLVCRG